jgi:hypothetical protein
MKKEETLENVIPLIKTLLRKIYSYGHINVERSSSSINPRAILFFIFFLSLTFTNLYSVKPQEITPIKMHENISKIINVKGVSEVIIENDVLMGVYAYDNSKVIIKNSTVFRAAKYDNAMLTVIDSRVVYLNDRYPLIENILKELITEDMVDEEKILTIHIWVKNFPVTSQNCFSNLSQIDVFNITYILDCYGGDCGSASSLIVSLSHSAGYPARLIQGKNHVVAEVYYDGAWHMIDGHLGANNAILYMEEENQILNSYQLFKNPERYDKDYFHIYQPEYNRFFDVGIAYLSVDGVQSFYSLDRGNASNLLINTNSFRGFGKKKESCIFYKIPYGDLIKIL